MLISNHELERLRQYQPKLNQEPSKLSAAVAIVLRDGDNGTEFLLMQRAKHDADPWSGQMAFPGGKVEQADASSMAAAIRETAEEVAVELQEQDYIGQIDDIYGHNISSKNNLHISCYVFKPEHELSPSGNHEVADIVWMPISFLNDANNAHDFYHPKDPSMKMPAVMINVDREQVLWGLSLRMLQMMFEILDKPFTPSTYTYTK